MAAFFLTHSNREFAEDPFLAPRGEALKQWEMIYFKTEVTGGEYLCCTITSPKLEVRFGENTIDLREARLSVTSVGRLDRESAFTSACYRPSTISFVSGNALRNGSIRSGRAKRLMAFSAEAIAPSCQPGSDDT